MPVHWHLHPTNRLMRLSRELVPVIMLLFLSSVVVLVAAVGRLPLAVADTQPLPNHPLVETSYGRLRGIQEPGKDGDAYDAFYGIPFAQPPVGALRFANPVEPLTWYHVRDATAPKDDCIQKNSLLPGQPISGSEDCLYLNLYRPLRPANQSNELLSVIVFIHGGAFFTGSAGPAVLGPQYFMNTGQVIFVAMAYRLGAFGFLSTGDHHSPGNYGLKDQTMALRWVQRNVRRFGGDPLRVTIMGVSAGGSSVHMHMMSTLSTGLFHRAVSMSGNALGPYNNPCKHPEELARKQANVLGIQANNTRDLIARLRTFDARKLVDSVDGLKFWSIDPLTLYRPVVEACNRPGAFLTNEPHVISESIPYNQVPWLQGTVQNEGAIRATGILANATLLADFNANFDRLLLPLMELPVAAGTVEASRVSELLRQRYFDGSHGVMPGNEQKFIDLYSDRSFLYPWYNSIHDFVRSSKDIDQTPVYLYKFLYKGPISFSAVLTGSTTDYGVVHLDDTIYLFQTAFWPPFGADSTEGKLTRTLVKFYVDFAVNGKPTELASPIEPCTAEKINSDSFCDYYKFFNSDESADGFAVTVDNYFDFTMVDFWNDILNVTKYR